MGVHGITANGIAPGGSKTAQKAVMYENQEWVDYLFDRIPLKRTGKPRPRRGGSVPGIRGKRIPDPPKPSSSTAESPAEPPRPCPRKRKVAEDLLFPMLYFARYGMTAENRRFSVRRDLA